MKTEREALIRITLNDESRWNLLGGVIVASFTIIGFILGLITEYWLVIPR
jgi:hypothetical protein